MDKMTSMLLMLVVLGVFIHSSQAVKCYDCGLCVKPRGSVLEMFASKQQPNLEVCLRFECNCSI